MELHIWSGEETKKYCQPKNLYPAKISLESDKDAFREIKTECMVTSKLVLEEVLSLQAERK